MKFIHPGKRSHAVCNTDFCVGDEQCTLTAEGIGVFKFACNLLGCELVFETFSYDGCDVITGGTIYLCYQFSAARTHEVNSALMHLAEHRAIGRDAYFNGEFASAVGGDGIQNGQESGRPELFKQCKVKVRGYFLAFTFGLFIGLRDGA